MGMGEPLNNVRSVRTALEVFCQGPRHFEYNNIRSDHRNGVTVLLASACDLEVQQGTVGKPGSDPIRCAVRSDRIRGPVVVWDGRF